MQVFGNVATVPERKVSKTSGKGYYQLRLCEAQKGQDKFPTFYTVRIMKDENPNLALGDFVRVTGKLKADFYIGRDGKPSGTLLIIAFDAMKIAKPMEQTEGSKGQPSVQPRALEPALAQIPEPIQVSVQELVQDDFESDWTRLYN
jgi:hypothetical protein